VAYLKDRGKLNRRLVIALAGFAIVGGCATSFSTNRNALAVDRSTSPNLTSPAPRPFSNFGSAERHWFGSGGP